MAPALPVFAGMPAPTGTAQVLKLRSPLWDERAKEVGVPVVDLDGLKQRALALL